MFFVLSILIPKSNICRCRKSDKIGENVEKIGQTILYRGSGCGPVSTGLN